MKSNLHRLCLCLCFVLVLPAGAVRASPPVAAPLVVSAGPARQPVGTSMAWLRDPGGRLSFDDVTSGAAAAQFVQADRQVPGFGSTRAAYWARFAVRNEAAVPVERLLVSRLPLLWRIDLWQVCPDETHRFESGLSRPDARRGSGGRHYVFPVEVPPQASCTFFARLQTPAMMALDFTFWEPDAYQSATLRSLLLLGVHNGILLALILFNFLLYLTARDRAYLLYALFLTIYGAYHAGLSGLASYHLWRQWPWWGLHSVLVFAALLCISGLYFARSFLLTPRYAPGLDRLIPVLAVLAGLSGALGMVDYGSGHLATAGTGAATVMLVLVAAVRCHLRGHQAARYFLIAWGFFLAGGLLFIAATAGVLPPSPTNMNMVHVGASVGAVLLTFAVGRRIARLRTEYEGRLEGLVKRRTHELQQVLHALHMEMAARRETRERLRRVLENLERSNEELEQFAYVASHDLQEPLRTVASYCELLARRYGPSLQPDQSRHLEEAIAGTHQMQRLINDLLAYSRVHTRGQELTPVTPEPVARAVVAANRALIEESGAAVDIGPLPAVMADADQLHLLLDHLLRNGLVFRGDSPPRITISAHREDGQVRFEVKDNGRGMTSAQREEAFGLFARWAAPGDPIGTGTGLAICKRIVERHDGRIGIGSRPGGGTLVWFELTPATDGGEVTS